jgi:uncharacterized repeat protein (TIGR01451 family)
MNFKKLIATSLFTAAFLATAGSAIADGTGYGTSNCQVIYGGGQVCPTTLQFSIDKKVLAPTKGGTFVDNLGFNDSKFQPGDQVSFKITLKNTGDKTIDQITVVDTLPAYLTFTSGPGVYDATSRTITYIIKNLASGQSNDQTVVATIANVDSLPKDQGVMCLTNNVKGNDNQSDVANDSSTFCIQKEAMTPKVFTTIPPKSIPNTGPEMLPLLGLIPAGIAGFTLRKKSKLG